MKKISDQIKERQALRKAATEKMTGLVTAAETASRAFEQEEQDAFDQLENEVREHDEALVRLAKMETMLGERAAPAAGSSVVRASGGEKNREKGELVFRQLASQIIGHVSNESPIVVAERIYKGDEDVPTMIRAASAPATTTAAGWASELVQTSRNQFLELLRMETIFFKVPGYRFNYDGNAGIPMPSFTSGTLAGGFIAEGSPIPVKQGTTTSQTLLPYKMAVISSFTKELARRSTPTIEGLIRQAILDDTRDALDAALLNNVAVGATRPAGFQNAAATGAGNINAASGTGDMADVLADVRALNSRMVAAKAGRVGAWIMSPARKLALEFAMTPLGQPAFPSVSSGVFAGAPILETDQIADTIVIAVAQTAIAFGNDYSPIFDVSDQATLHFEDTTPLAISTTGSPNTVAAPVRSLFQTDCVAVKMTMGLGWKLVRPGGIQVVTAVAWGEG